MTAKTMRNERNAPQIKIAWIGLIGTVITVMGTILVAAVNNWKITPQSSQVPTIVASSALVSPASLIPPALSVQSVPTQLQIVGDYSIPGQDWMHDCIGPSWVTFPIGTFQRDSNGCLQQPLPSVISAQNGTLSLLSQTSANSARIFGISTVLPLRSNVEMHLTLNQIQTGQVWIGILGDSDPLNSPGMMMIMSQGDVQNQVFVVRQIPQGREFLRSASIPAEAGGYDVDLAIDNGSVTFKVNSMQSLPFPLSFGNRTLFIGFRNQFGFNQVDARISNLKISGN
ncbi:MAG TPA: hypothetical protein VIN60_00680 [Anaerolineales bacterium]